MSYRGIGSALPPSDQQIGGAHHASDSRLRAAAILAAVGLVVAGYLAACQVGLVTVWDPLFGSDSSEKVLHSWLSRNLPVPDAALGAVGYVVELSLAVLLLRWRSVGLLNAWVRVAYGAAAVGMALAGAFLVGVQVLSLRAFCTLCLLSAALSWALLAVALPTLRDGARTLLALAETPRRT